MKILKLFTLSYLLVFSVQAQENIASNAYDNNLRDIKEQINDLQSVVDDLETYINEVITCGDKTPPQHYDGTSCVTITERDPNIESHGKKALSGSSCTDSDKAQQYRSGNWGCKTYN
ncbi:MAG: hypothetical protein CMF60_00640 [Magnetococcales bacterium]|nr:hypothetical protein [Magnetococcales bacterium]MEC8066795.1 hypothetical protein [Pseudomonadota bacterium]